MQECSSLLPYGCVCSLINEAKFRKRKRTHLEIRVLFPKFLTFRVYLLIASDLKKRNKNSQNRKRSRCNPEQLKYPINFPMKQIKKKSNRELREERVRTLNQGVRSLGIQRRKALGT